MPTISTSTPFSAPSEVMASTVNPSPTPTLIDLASPLPISASTSPLGLGSRSRPVSMRVIKPRLFSASGSTALPMNPAALVPLETMP